MPDVRILLLTYGVPWPLNSGARIRDFNLLRASVLEGAHVTLCCFAKDEREIPDLLELRGLCHDVRVYRPPRRSLAGHLAAIWRAVRDRRPIATSPFFYPEFAAELRSVAERDAVKIFQIEHTFLAGYLCAVPANCRSVLSLHNIGSQQYARIARLATGCRCRCGFCLKALLMRQWEADYAARFDHCIVVSSADAGMLRGINPAVRVSVVENGVDCHRFQPLPEEPASNDILFTGVLAYPPNADAVRFFCREILPRVRRDVPEARFLIVGQEPPKDILSLANPGSVMIFDGVADVIPYYRRTRLSVVPLRAGGGTRLKVLESMALGRAVVSTTIGCEGIEVAHGRELLIADEAAAFARHVVSLLRDGQLRCELTARARRAMEVAYDWPHLAAKQFHAYTSLLSS